MKNSILWVSVTLNIILLCLVSHFQPGYDERLRKNGIVVFLAPGRQTEAIVITKGKRQEWVADAFQPEADYRIFLMKEEWPDGEILFEGHQAESSMKLNPAGMPHLSDF